MSRKGNKPTEPRKTPIYRATERLLSWAMPIVNSLPKSLASQTLGGLTRFLKPGLTPRATLATTAEKVLVPVALFQRLIGTYASKSWRRDQTKPG